MNTNNFRILVEGLESFSKEDRDCKEQEIIAAERLKDGRITTDMLSDISAEFSDVLFIVAEYIPEFKEMYEGRADFCYGEFEIWINTLNEFLECDFIQWTRDYAGVWGNESGYLMHYSNEAFSKSDDKELLTIDDIIFHIRKAYDRWIKLMET